MITMQQILLFLTLCGSLTSYFDEQGHRQQKCPSNLVDRSVLEGDDIAQLIIAENEWKNREIECDIDFFKSYNVKSVNTFFHHFYLPCVNGYLEIDPASGEEPVPICDRNNFEKIRRFKGTIARIRLHLNAEKGDASFLLRATYIYTESECDVEDVRKLAWLGSLQSENTGASICGAIMISEGWILSSYSCIRERWDGIADIVVHMDPMLNRRDKMRDISRRVYKVGGMFNRNDLALLKLLWKRDTGPQIIRPVRLSKEAVSDGTLLSVASWGLPVSAATANVPLQWQCTRVLATPACALTEYDETLACATPWDPQDGGGLVLSSNYADGLVLRGIVFKKAQSGVHNVMFSDISFFQSWINNFTRPDYV